MCQQWSYCSFALSHQYFELADDMPQLGLVGELWDICCSYLGELTVLYENSSARIRMWTEGMVLGMHHTYPKELLTCTHWWVYAIVPTSPFSHVTGPSVRPRACKYLIILDVMLIKLAEKYSTCHDKTRNFFLHAFIKIGKNIIFFCLLESM